MGFLDGALRIMPAWEISVFGHPLTLAVLVPGVLVPGAFFTILAVYPLLDRRLTGVSADGRLLDRPHDAAKRTAFGAAGLTFYGLLWAAAANDEIAYHLSISLYAVGWFSGWRCWPPRSWRTRSPSGCASAWPGGNGTKPSTDARPAGS